MFSLTSSFFSTHVGKLYQHYGNSSYGYFYNAFTDSTVKVVLNSQPSTMKVFQTVNYEGGNDWIVTVV